MAQTQKGLCRFFHRLYAVFIGCVHEKDQKILDTDPIAQFEEEAGKCVLCGACQAVCPVYAETLDETRVARGRMALLDAVLSRKLQAGDQLDEILATCIGCRACSTHCPSGVAADLANLSAKLTLGRDRGLPFYRRLLARKIFPDPGRLTYAARLLAMMGRRIYTPLSGIRRVRPLLPYVRNGRPREIPSFQGPAFRKRDHENRLEGERVGRVALFYGCAIDQIFPDWGETAIRILNRRGIEVVLPEKQVCCGAPALFMGDASAAEKVMEENLSAFSEGDVDAVITLCATCGSTLRELYPRLFDREEVRSLAAKVMDLGEFLAARDPAAHEIDQARDGAPLRVTYHDPCHLKRGMGVSEAPRRILSALPGIEFVEMKDADRCCGGGGLFSLSHYDLSLKIGRHKVDRIRETGAEVVATACPSCAIQLSDLLRREGLPIRVVHVCELMDNK